MIAKIGNCQVEYFYRIQESLSSDCASLICWDFPIVKRTRHGVWLWVWGAKRFVLTDARKKFACATKEEALISFQARKKRQIHILEHQLEKARRAFSQSLNYPLSDPHELHFD